MRSTWNEGRFGGAVFMGRIPTLGVSRNYLGVTEQEWYNRAKAAVSEFDRLLDKARYIAGLQERNAVFDWLGDPAVMASNWGQRNALDYNVRTADATGVAQFVKPDNQSRTQRVEAIDKEFAVRVAEAEARGGIASRPAATPAAPTPVAAAPNYTVPILVGAGAIALALALKVI